MTGNFFLLLGVGAFITALTVNIGLVKRRHPRLGWLLGLLPILIFGIGFIIPPLTCKSDNPVGCEWAGIGVLFIGGLTIIMLAVYSLFAVGVTRVLRPLEQDKSDLIPYKHPLARSLGAIALLTVLALIGGLAGFGGFRLVETGIFVPWRSQGTPPDLDSLPGERAAAIQGITLGSIQIITNEGRVFETRLDYCASSQRVSQNCWYYGSNPLASGKPQQAESSCRKSFWVPTPPGTVVERMEISTCMVSDMMQTSYILRTDGSVWAWHHETRKYNIQMVLWVAGGALVGMIMGVLLGFKSSK